MSSKTYEEQSRTNWTPHPSRGKGADKIVELGCLQRIATSIEKISLDRDELIGSRDAARSNRDEWMERCLQVERSNSALRGVITRLRNKMSRS